MKIETCLNFLYTLPVANESPCYIKISYRGNSSNRKICFVRFGDNSYLRHTKVLSRWRKQSNITIYLLLSIEPSLARRPRIRTCAGSRSLERFLAHMLLILQTILRPYNQRDGRVEIISQWFIIHSSTLLLNITLSPFPILEATCRLSSPGHFRTAQTPNRLDQKYKQNLY